MVRHDAARANVMSHRQPGDPTMTERLPSAVVCVIQRRSDGKFLLMQRALHDVAGGWWSCVTGAMEAGEDEATAARREAMEEVGLAVEVGPRVWKSLTHRRNFDLFWRHCWVAGGEPLTPDPNEVADTRWVDAGEVRAMIPAFADLVVFFEEILPTVREVIGG
jgi:8-oxo-dGTP pyrophosphatase MutT (NUDIX family)